MMSELRAFAARFSCGEETKPLCFYHERLLLLARFRSHPPSQRQAYLCPAVNKNWHKRRHGRVEAQAKELQKAADVDKERQQPIRISSSSSCGSVAWYRIVKHQKACSS